MTTAAVVVIGGGVMGASVAYHLAARGATDVRVLDAADRPGLGSTGSATGGFRAQFGSAIHVRLSLLSREKLQRFADEVGGDPGYVQYGYLWLATSEAELDALRAALVVQHGAGLQEAREVSREDIASLNPRVLLGDVVGGTFSPTDGFMRPLAVLDGYIAAATRLRVRFDWGVAVTDLKRDATGTITTACTTRGDVDAETVVNAAGPWAADVAAMAGVALPVAAVKRQVAVTVPTAVLPDTMPMTIFAGDGFHLRVRDGRVLLLWPDARAPSDLPPPAGSAPVAQTSAGTADLAVEDEWIAAVTEKAHRRVPVLRRVPIDRSACRACFYEMSPDHHVILGRAAECRNLFLINGSSGHGVMHAPALGQLLAEMIVDGEARTLDVRPLRPSRFPEGEPNVVEMI